MDEYVSPLKGRMFADPESLGKFVNDFGLAQATKSVELLEGRIKLYKAKTAWMKSGGNKLMTNDPLQGYQGSVAELEANVKQDEILLAGYKEIVAALQGSNMVLDFYKGVQQGRVKPELARKVNQGFESNNMVQVLDGLANENFLDDTQKKLIENFKQYSKTGGLMGMLFVFLLIKKASEKGNGQSQMT